MTPRMMGEWGDEGGECDGQRSGRSLLHRQASMVAMEAQKALQYTPRHVEGGPFFNGHPSSEQGEYAQQQYFMPGPPAALPMRLAVNMDSDSIRGHRHSWGERKQNGSKRLQREQPRSLPDDVDRTTRSS